MNSLRKTWDVAVYARVSSDKKEQQESMPAQVESLKKWLLEKSETDCESVYNLVEIYEDVGFSGSNFERDSFIRMKEDIEQGKINMIVTRDLSRFSRNYITAGYYLEEYFKINEVRFISVLDNVDTLQEINDIIPFKNILNEMYIKDCSRRSRDGLKQRMIRGSSIASKPPYGYKFEEEYAGNVKTIRLVAEDDETTETVKEIFELYLKGYGFGRLASYLNSKGIAPPSAKLNNFSLSKFGLWTNNTIKTILNNPKYGGIMVQGRWRKISYKIKKVRPTLQEEWIYGGEFKGIVSKEIFEQVQNIISKRSKSYRYKGQNIYMFSSVLKCNECGGGMSYRKKFQGYKCTNSQMGGGRCTAHSLKEDELKDIITYDLMQSALRELNVQEIYNNIDKFINKRENHGNKYKNIESELKKLDRQFEELYSDKFNGRVSERNFEILSNSIEKKQQELVNRKKEMLINLEVSRNYDDMYVVYKNEIDKVLRFQNLDRIMVENLVEKIIVSEDKKMGQKSIDIFYKFKI
ncbi:recombinase family protein [Clostridium estertheticum]|uniref:recombinase family protein n=1 Tax=Clostridium estertheticum TaxID=238834 RepID=UPI0029620951|nr:recombinase family protein [Clostridium estertheticum]